jgi:hypothetical protein
LGVFAPLVAFVPAAFFVVFFAGMFMHLCFAFSRRGPPASAEPPRRDRHTGAVRATKHSAPFSPRKPKFH